MTVLSKNQMEIGMLPGENIFAMILYQNGGSYYNEDASRSALDSIPVWFVNVLSTSDLITFA